MQRKDLDTNNKIDFVIIWVDGGDTEWIKSKNFYLNQYSKSLESSNEIDANENRYRDWDILKYWFRSVEKYAPWVNKVHFVTCGHVPSWLNMSAEKLHFVKHDEYIPEEYLPTFSSHPIELNLHRIKELNEQFVYFNDDFFLTAPVEKDDFFKNGLPCDCFVENPLEMQRRELYNSIRVNDVIFASEHFPRIETNKKLWTKRYSLKHPKDSVKNLLLSFVKKEAYFGIDTHHLPQAYLKRTLENVWETEYGLLDETCTHKFRDARDISQFIFKFWQLLSGEFVPYNKRKFGKAYQIGVHLDEICHVIRNREYKAICLNDSNVTDFEYSKNKLIAAFEDVFPEKSSFEI